jgi:DNA polymerase-3 subunit beta
MDSEIRVENPQGGKKKGSSKKEGNELMEFTIAKRDFVRGLARTQSIAERKSSMPILSNVLVGAEGASTIRLSATDLAVGVSGAYTADVKSSGSIALGARTLFDIVRALPEEPIHLAVSSTLSAELRCGRSRFRMVGMPGVDFPSLPDAGKVEFTTVPSALVLELVQKTSAAMSQDETRPHLAGALFEGDGKILRMVTTDGHRLTKAERKIDGDGMLHFSMLVPLKGVSELKRLAEDTEGAIQIGTDGIHAFFRSEGTETQGGAKGSPASEAGWSGATLMSVKLVEAAFPPYEQVIPRGHDRVVIAPRPELMEALRRVSLVSQERSLGVKLALDAGKLVVSTENPEIGDASEELDVDYAGTPVTLGFNAKYLLDALSAVDDAEVRMELSKELDPGVLRNVSGDALLAVVMPMRI